jgi:hypothetical protein
MGYMLAGCSTHSTVPDSGKTLISTEKDKTYTPRLTEEEVLRMADEHAAGIKKKDFDLKYYPDRKAEYNEVEHSWLIFYTRQPNRWPGDHFAIIIQDETGEIRYHGGA